MVGLLLVSLPLYASDSPTYKIDSNGALYSSLDKSKPLFTISDINEAKIAANMVLGGIEAKRKFGLISAVNDHTISKHKQHTSHPGTYFNTDNQSKIENILTHLVANANHFDFKISTQNGEPRLLIAYDYSGIDITPYVDQNTSTHIGTDPNQSNKGLNKVIACFGFSKKGDISYKNITLMTMYPSDTFQGCH